MKDGNEHPDGGVSDVVVARDVEVGEVAGPPQLPAVVLYFNDSLLVAQLRV